MRKENRILQVDQMIKDSLQSLFINQTWLTFDKFAVSTLEALMLLEREEYLKSSVGIGDSGNGSYPRDFKSLRLNSLKINIPRTRNGSFKPVTLELINTNKEQVNGMRQFLCILCNMKRLCIWICDINLLQSQKCQIKYTQMKKD